MHKLTSFIHACHYFVENDNFGKNLSIFGVFGVDTEINIRTEF